ncbi:hypothetical protein N7448_002110 [Penicillium atrosanguineum]|uniref:Uncharacterized protein n=1 Tax=Penicillium atrosanguineum TaxID=1132637 RepID=A0A9W9HDF8_9EURO|nr:cytochrome c oxidase assembly protein [Penicillium atrosanguineum]KAJ5128391.1 hypothetical protein N7526_006557 [Penicillium atrosanguineum]KAJ5144718.1 hypothetical protein N7448_002110 [Penicillium atrosanguineum]KAJ5300509.1 cytochrome c oxidase assembly protein [Penicillium atrosanguineum]KAJ5311153.1 hypothetical protein N7476_007013 [Penicillium atrosanguineum]
MAPIRVSDGPDERANISQLDRSTGLQCRIDTRDWLQTYAAGFHFPLVLDLDLTTPRHTSSTAKLLDRQPQTQAQANVQGKGDMESIMDFFYSEKQSGFEPRDSSHYMSRSMRILLPTIANCAILSDVEFQLHAGNTDCQFLRVQSESLGTFSQFPYPSLGAAIASPHLGGMFAPHTARKSMLPTGSPQARMDGFSRTQEFDLADSHVFSRPDGVDSIPYENEQSVHYSQSATYILPNAPSGSTLDYGAAPWSPKIWDSMFSRQNNGVIYPDPETNNSLNQYPYSYMLPSQGISSNDTSQSNTATMTVVSSAKGSGTDRTLPTPTCASNAAHLNVLSPEPNLAQLSEFKSNYWNQRSVSSTDQRTPAHTVPSNAPKCTASTAPDLLFAYVPVPTTTDETIPTLSTPATGPSSSNSTTSFTGLDLVDHEYRSIPDDRRFSRKSNAGQRLTMTNERTPDIYGYSSEKRPRDSATLMNGLPYQRVRHPDTSSPFSFNLLPDTLPEYHRVVENVHRSPISPLGNQGAY